MIEIAILKNFDSGTYKAGVQLAGSLTTYFDDISVAKNIPSSALVIGNYVILAIPGGNPRDACVIATWPGGSAGGGSFLDLSDTPSSYESQAGKVAKVNSAEDALEFEQFDLLGLLAEKVMYFGDWRTIDQYTDYTTGSGVVDWDGIIQLTLRTGATNGSHAAKYSNYSGLWRLRANHHILMQIEGDGIVNDAATIRFYVQCITGATTPPADTDKHFGWKVKNKRIWATVADGTTETEVDTGIDIDGNYTNYKLHMVSNWPDNVKFYINGALVATITTNLYSQSTHRFWFGIVNTAAKDQRIRIDYHSYLS